MREILITLPIILIIFGFGAAIGSFLNVVVYRIPAGLSILWPPSRCPHCLTTLKANENVPVLGWFWLKGRCRHCHSPISWRYPAVEAATGLLFLLVFWTTQTPEQTWGNWVFFSWLLALSLIDLDTMTLPNILTQSGLMVGLCFQFIIGLWPVFAMANGIHQLMFGVMGAVMGIWLLEIIAMVGSIAFGKTAMGAGDPKLAAMMGAWLGWKHLLLAGFIACVLGAFLGGAGIALGWLDRRQPMAFGPFLAAGAGIAAIWGEALLSAYFHWFFPTLIPS